MVIIVWMMKNALTAYYLSIINNYLINRSFNLSEHLGICFAKQQNNFRQFLNIPEVLFTP